jgi:hypothetical protein
LLIRNSEIRPEWANAGPGRCEKIDLLEFSRFYF